MLEQDRQDYLAPADADKTLRRFRNAILISGIGITSLLNASEPVRELTARDQIVYNSAGIGLAVLGALGIEYGRRNFDDIGRTFSTMSSTAEKIEDGPNDEEE